MNEKKTKLAIKGILAGTMNRTITLLLPFVGRTVLIYTIGAQYLGLNSVFTSILSILSFAELGFGNVMVYSMYKPIAEHNEEKVMALLNLYKQLYRIIGLIVLLIGLAIMPFIRYLIKGDYPADVNLYLLYLIYLFNSVVSYWLFTYKSSLLEAHQMYYVEHNISTVITFVTYTCQILALLLFRNYYLYIIFVPLATVATNIGVAITTRRYYPNIKAKGTVDQKTRESIRRNVLAGIGHRLGPSATTSVDNLVISSFSGLTLAAVYSNYNFILTTVTGFVSLVFSSFIAGIGNSLVVESKEKNYEDFKFFTFINNILTGWSAICILCLSQPFMYLWIGKSKGAEYMYSSATLIILVFMYYAQQIRTIVQSYKTAAGMWYIDRYKPYVAAILNAILDIILFKTMGINGVLLSTIFARVAVGLPWETHAMFKEYFKQPKWPYYKSLLKYLLISVIVGVICYSICNLIPYPNIWWLVLRTIVCVLLVSTLYLAVYWKNAYVKRSIKKMALLLKNKQEMTS